MREELQPETLQVIDAPTERDDVDAVTGCEGGPRNSGQHTSMPDADGDDAPLDEKIKDIARDVTRRVKGALPH